MSTVGESFLVGLIGEGVIPSLTPPMHEREADHQGLRYLYRPIDLMSIGRPGSDIGVLLHQARDLGFNACNVTHPCKQEVLAHLDDISVTAAAIGAVNTVLITDGRLVGDNTDVSGFGIGTAQRTARGGPRFSGPARRGRGRCSGQPRAARGRCPAAGDRRSRPLTGR